MNKKILKINNISSIFFILFSFILLFFFLNNVSKVNASCWVSCSGACTEQSSCGEDVAGCASGRSGTWCCPYTVTCSCTAGSCGGCTPSCPSGQSTTVSGSLCKSGSTSSCTGSDGCNSCTLTGSACYYTETNTTFVQSNGSTSGPASISMIIDGKTYQLSTDSNNPTHIKLPASGSSNVQVSVPTFTAPTTSRGGGYYFTANNYGNNNEWKTWVSCSGTEGEDFCTTVPNTSNTQNFVPTSKTVNQTLKEGASGKISGMYTTTDKCANTYKYSLPIEGYYVVDYTSDIVDPEDILQDISTDITAKGCSSLTSTGLEINNPLHVKATITDIDSTDEIQAFTLWFSKDLSVPTTATISSNCGTGSYYTSAGVCCPNNTVYSGGLCTSAITQPASTFSATGGTITYSGGYTIHTFTSSGTFTTNETGSVEALVVAGGGGGGGGAYLNQGIMGGGGGGAGGLIYSSSLSMSSGSYTVTVGNGGAGSSSGGAQGSNGENSVLSSLTAIGGGGGASVLGFAQVGGSGGGGCGFLPDYATADYDGAQRPSKVAGAAGTSGQGRAGGTSTGGSNDTNGSGGGGAGGVGTNAASGVAANGGAGLAYSISGVSTYYAGGGGGAAGKTGSNGAGGAGGGAAGGYSAAATANTGGGGGGGMNGYTGGHGGSGIVIIRYPTPSGGTCSDGYFLANTSACCPDNTSYTSGQCIAQSTSATTTTFNSSTSDLGIMIKSDGSKYITNDSLNWILLNDEYVHANGEDIIRIYDISVTSGTQMTFDYKLEFLENINNLYGTYYVYEGAIDSHMINENSIDQSYFSHIFNWNIDLIKPTIEDITLQVQDPISTKVTWSVSDANGISRTVINGYRVGGTEFDIAKLYLPTAYTTNKGDITLNSIPTTSQQIGLYNDTNAWIFGNNTGETDLLNIGTNESGKIDLYVTTYDNACNTTAESEEIDLDPWFATRGGAVYSQDNISTSAKDVSDVSALDNVFSTNTLMDKSLIDLGTELLATRNTAISTLIHSSNGAVRGELLYDSNNTKSYWFNQLMSKFSNNRSKSTSFENITTSVASDCPSGTTCYKYSDEDLTIPSGYVCSKPTLFISTKDIYIEPDITSNSLSLSGCIFLAENNIYILDGDYQSTNDKVEYDYVEGFLIAENQILFPLVDEEVSLRDGVEIFGGAVALGSSPVSGESAISIQRNLRLFNQTNPSVVLTYDNKYSSISSLFFGIETPIYRQEVGFKSF